ncbi:MAG: hypothetical protein M3R49_06580 [Chloroflexota bacterium]|nr:hypothetical protein [Chloroflexota bacterium]
MGQLVAYVRARVTPEQDAFAARLLPPGATRLFAEMPVADRRHGLAVAQRLLAGGFDDPELLAAALVHDAGKGRRMRLWHRVAAVLVDAAAPRLLARIASPDPASAGYPFHLYLHHGPISADAALAAGCSPRTAAFIRGSVAGADVRLADALHAADAAS